MDTCPAHSTESIKQNESIRIQDKYRTFTQRSCDSVNDVSTGKGRVKTFIKGRERGSVALMF